MSVSVIIPAYRARDTVGETVRAARSLPGALQVIVVDDGSGDGTGAAARDAGADTVIELPSNRGKGAALAAGTAAARGERLLLLDADLGDSARQAACLLALPGGEHAMVVAVLPSSAGAGGFGLARRLAHASIRLLAGLEMAAPLSGQRALPASLVRHIGLAPRFGVEVGLTVEAAHVGSPILEVPVAFSHHHTTRTLAGFRHRGRQFWDMLGLAGVVGYGMGWPALSTSRWWWRAVWWLSALLAIVVGSRLLSPASFPTVAITTAVGVAAWLPCLWVSSVWLRLRKPNYLGRRLPSAAGLMFPLLGLPYLQFAPLAPEVRASATAVIAGLAVVGLLDDLLAARRQARGLRGHLVALVHGRVTTGMMKAVGGIAVGLWAGLHLDPGRPLLIGADALLVAMAANAVNLLDLRPGRALKGFGLLAVVAIVASPNVVLLLGPFLAAAVVAAPADLAGRVMIGDVGANVLGGAVGFALAIVLDPWPRVAAVLLLAAFHVLCELVSVTDVMARSRALRALDRLGAAHLPPLPLAGGPAA